MKIEIPELCVVALVGATSSGKSTFAKKHFLESEVLSSDYFRKLLSDDENNQAITGDAFDALYTIAGLRLKNLKPVVIDATNIQPHARKKIIELSREYDCHAAAIVLNLPEHVLKERNKHREGRMFPDRVIERHRAELRSTLRFLRKEGFKFVYEIKSPEEAENAEIVRTKLYNNKKELKGPFDIIGDIHGCYDELCELLETLGYEKTADGYTHPENRTVLFLGDLCDRGPKNIAVLKLVMEMCANHNALCVLGNHDYKLQKYLRGKDVQLSNGFDVTVSELEKEDKEFKKKADSFIDSLISHYVLDNGNLVIAHGGIKESYQGRASGRIRAFCMFGDITGEKDESNLPVRLDWAAEYRGKATVVYGHTPNAESYILNNTYNIDTGCVFGGKLTAFRYPERETVFVNAKKEYAVPARPLNQNDEATESGDTLSFEDVGGKLIVHTELNSNITVNEENSAAALEIMSRFAADPHWLIYLPPTMSPCETSSKKDYLEYPDEAFKYFRENQIETVICEKKHMGSRAVIVVAKDKKAAQTRFGVLDNKQGIIYTRTGRHFFEDEQLEETIIKNLTAVLTKTHFWEDFKTDWACFDCELMPWSVKAQSLLEMQYAPVGCAGKESLSAAVKALEVAVKRESAAKAVTETTSGQNVDLNGVLKNYKEKLEANRLYTNAYREYCWTVNSVNDIKIAPFHLLASEGAVYMDKDHIWHIENIKKYWCADPMFLATEYIVVDVNNEESVNKGTEWWLELTKSGGEGMVVKPLGFIAKNNGKLIQPAVKCRGREYLRIIYGPEYTMPEHLTRLKKRGLGKKRILALREFSLGAEALQRFVRKEPLYRIHQCVFAVLALESEPVDPRL